MTAFIDTAPFSGASWFSIYLAEELAQKLTTQDAVSRELASWFFLHLAVQASSGHIRTDLRNFEKEFSDWYYFSGESADILDPELPGTLAGALDVILEAGRLSGILAQLPDRESPADSLEIPRPPLVLSSDRNHLYFLKRRRSEDVFLSHLNLRAENRPDSVFQCPAILPEDAAGEIMKCLSDGFRFLILSGGPGTGKTTTIARLLSLIREGSRIGARRSVRIALTAPTGRAAARLGEALSGEESGSTLHSLLGLAPHRPPKHSCEDPLPYDLVIVDEASMVDLPTMNLLLDALSPSSVLLLVGDPDQLPSVEAGALLGDLLSGLEKAVEGRTVSPLKDTVFTLRKVYRSHTSILSSAAAVRDGRLEAFLESGRDDGVRIHPLLSPEKTAALIASSFQDAFELGRQHSEPDTTLFDAYAARGILTPLRRGLWGVAALNDRISLLLGGRTLPFAGMPLMVTGNDRSRNLWNGDKGVLLEKEGRLRAFFPAASEGFREYSLAALPGWEPAWIQTIHKSQGSEFDAVTILLPPGADRILSREILYTALTRARHTADLYSDPETIAVSLERKVSRNSRIRDWAAGI